MKAFKAYDIRGIYNVDFTKEDVYKIGYFLPEVLMTEKILVGRDVRESSYEILEYLIKGITDAGADVYDAGLATTPMIYYSTAKLGFEGSVMITASHNPANHNGLKVSGIKAKPIGYDNGLKKLEHLVEYGEIFPSPIKGKLHKLNIKEPYIDFLSKFVPKLSGLKVSIDCSNGMIGLIIKELLGNIPMYIYDNLDGTFPNHDPNPLNPKNLEDLQKHVAINRSDIGVIFDGDADRVMFLDENAQFISPDLMLAVIGHYFFEEKGLRGKVVQDIRTTKAVGEYLAQWDAEVITWRVGRAYAATKLKEVDGIFGGELAGHYYFKDFYYSDSGMLACLIILNVIERMHNKGISVSKLISQIKKYYNSGEINYKIEKKQEAMDAIVEFYKNMQTPELLLDFDGYRIEYKNWWLSIRPSNTEPYLRFLAEANSDDILKNVVKTVTEIVEKFGGNIEK
ncbi:MAG: phosphomannomutase/phosphoglucomutase [Bacteroidales bacterium]|nr:phosphomannomutase/phosphoglucomutase [Bacteroidales bacterium]